MIDQEDDACIAYLVRHGATASNLANPPILQGRSINGPLSETGKRQADAAASCLSGLPIGAIYSSPLVRAQQTASIIAHHHALAVNTVDEITEVDVGAWEHRSWHEIEQAEPDAYHRFQNDPANHGYRDGENLNDVSQRVMPALQRVMSDHPGEQIVIVAHNVVNRVVLSEAIELPLLRARKLTQNNCGINTLRWQHGRIKVISMNACLHLHGTS